MHAVSQRFIAASILYLLAGSTLGVSFFFIPGAVALRPVHVHLNLLGFMSMMIYGVLYHVLPRFIGRPLYSYKLAWFHFYASNIALIGMGIFMGLSYTLGGAAADWFSIAGFFGMLQLASMFVFAGNIFKTMKG